MRRLFWMAVGAGAGIYAVRKVTSTATRTAEAFTPAGVSSGLSDLAQSLRYFADEVRAGMSEREEELREALGLAEDGTALEPRDPAGAAALLDNPSGPRVLRSRPAIEDT
jgi:hypothetical protein